MTDAQASGAMWRSRMLGGTAALALATFALAAVATGHAAFAQQTVVIGGSGLPAIEVDARALNLALGRIPPSGQADAGERPPVVDITRLRMPEAASPPRRPSAPAVASPSRSAPARTARASDERPTASGGAARSAKSSTPATPVTAATAPSPPRVPATLLPAEIGAPAAPQVAAAPAARPATAAPALPARRTEPAAAPAQPREAPAQVAARAPDPPPAARPAAPRAPEPPPAPSQVAPSRSTAPLVPPPLPDPRPSAAATPPPPSLAPARPTAPPPTAIPSAAAPTAAPTLAPPRPTAAPAPTQVATLAVPKPPAGTRLATRLVFGPGAVQVGGELEGRLREIAAGLAGTDTRVLLEGHAGTGNGDPGTSRRQSFARALAVRKFLIQEGVKSTRIDIRALGEANDDGPAERVDVLYLNP